MRKWACAACGAFFGRRFCAERHINNPNLHRGDADLVGYEEYITGVRTDRFPPPKHAYVIPIRKSLKHSSVTPSEIRIGYNDVVLDDWLERFSEMYQRILSQERGKSLNKSLSKDERGGLLYVNFFGYICPYCLCIGVTYDEQAALSINDQGHVCEVLLPESISNSRLGGLMGGLGERLSALLFNVVKSVAVGRPLVLIGNPDDPKFTALCYSVQQAIRETDKVLYSLHTNRLLMSDQLLSEYFRLYQNTSNSNYLQRDGRNYKYDLRLAIQLWL